jgi:hypothetical protein
MVVGAWLAAHAWRQRSVLAAIAIRVGWWAALALLWRGSSALLSGFDPAHSPARLALDCALAGLVLVAPALVLGASAGLRALAFALGLAHVVLATLAHATLQ